MKKGIINTVLYYVFGFVIVWIISISVKQTYMHGPGIHHLIGVLVLVLGFLWAVFSGVKMLYRPSENLKGIIVGNAIILSVIFISVLIFSKV